jgi:peptidoglycan/xylan/chitin deacetylase (PgdA/CDA1 family)
VAAGVLAMIIVAGCASVDTAPADATKATPSKRTEATPGAMPVDGQVLAQDDRLLLYRAGSGDTFDSIAARWLGSTQRAWEIATLNQVEQATVGQALIVPLKPINPLGVYPGRLQTVQVLCYHRMGTPGTSNGQSRMTVSADRFAEQIDWLLDNGYRVVTLSDVAAFMAGRLALPPRSVVLTFDDGYESFHRLAWPILRKHGLPATVFVYTDFVGAADALSWPQLRELAASGLVDVQAHSRMHSNLAQRGAEESDEAWRARIELEVRAPREVLLRQLGAAAGPIHFYAYPFGDANENARNVLRRQGYDLAVTVTPGGVAFHAHPLMLRRTMILGSHDLEAFKARLQTERAWSLPH